MGFKKFDGSNSGRGPSIHPRITLWSSGKLAFNEPAVEQYLGDAEQVEMFTHDVDPIVAIKPTGTETETSYVLHTKGNYNGKMIHARALLKDMRCVRPDEAMILDTTYDDDAGWVEVDLSPVLDA